MRQLHKAFLSKTALSFLSRAQSSNNTGFNGFESPFNPNNRIQGLYYDCLDPQEASYYLLAKGVYCQVSFVTPQEYFRLCAEARVGYKKTDIHAPRRERNAVNMELAQEYANKMENGELFPICMVDFKHNTQEGRHRAQASELLGIQMFPCVIIRPVTPKETAVIMGCPRNEGWEVKVGGTLELCLYKNRKYMATLDKRDFEKSYNIVQDILKSKK